jgi:hypothetical protein
MELRISIEGADDDSALAALYRWLARDSDLVRQSRISLVSAPPAPGEQGGTLEAISAVLANATALGGLVTAVLTYRDARRRTDPRASVRLERDGVVVTIPPGSQVPIEQIITRLAGLSESGEGAEGS